MDNKHIRSKSKHILNRDYKDKSSSITPIPITYHLIIPTHNKESLFTSSSTCNYLAFLIFETATLHNYNLFAFCIMPDHVHILCQPGNVLVEHFVNLLKLRFEYILLKNGHKTQVWHGSFDGYPLPDERVIDTALHIFENPVKSGLADKATDYPYSYVYGGKDYRP